MDSKGFFLVSNTYGIKRRKMVHKNAPTCHSSILIYLGVLQDIEGIQNKINEFKNKKHSLYLIKLMCGARR